MQIGSGFSYRVPPPSAEKHCADCDLPEKTKDAQAAAELSPGGAASGTLPAPTTEGEASSASGVSASPAVLRKADEQLRSEVLRPVLNVQRAVAAYQSAAQLAD